MSNDLHIALVSGPAYDPLYDSLPGFSEANGITINIAFRGDHPTLNHHLAGLAEVPYDLVSTHTKYAPSQLSFLALHSIICSSCHSSTILRPDSDLARIEGKLYSVPRNIDVRLLHYRTDLIDTPPETWDELLATARAINSPPELFGFIFPGRESGLFGTFFELAEMAAPLCFLKPGAGYRK